MPSPAPFFEVLSSLSGSCSLEHLASLALLFDVPLMFCTISYFRGVILKSKQAKFTFGIKSIYRTLSTASIGY